MNFNAPLSLVSNLEMIKNKVREELKNAITKENYLSEEDAKLINDFLNKIKFINININVKFITFCQIYYWL